eukprot:289815_1
MKVSALFKVNLQQNKHSFGTRVLVIFFCLMSLCPTTNATRGYFLAMSGRNNTRQLFPELLSIIEGFNNYSTEYCNALVRNQTTARSRDELGIQMLFSGTNYFDLWLKHHNDPVAKNHYFGTSSFTDRVDHLAIASQPPCHGIVDYTFMMNQCNMLAEMTHFTFLGP